MRRLVILAVATLLALGTLPATAVPAPIVASGNVELLTTIPDVAAISTAFSSDTPHMYVNTLNGVTIYDISDPAAPSEIGRLPMPHFENEGMTLGERGKKKFLLVGIDVYNVAPTDPDQPVTDDYHFLVVDVTDPTNPTIRGRTDTKTSTHTISCAGRGCRYAYTVGAYDDTFEIYDLRNLDEPRFVRQLSSPVTRKGSGSGHQWTVDDAGYLWVAGWGGTAAYNVTDPTQPRVVASTDANGSRSPYNDFIQHNTYRPLARRFDQSRSRSGRVRSGSRRSASVFDGNVLLITEEDYDNPDCQGVAGTDAPEGGFSTWHVPSMHAGQYRRDNPTGEMNGGRIRPLDTWNTELANSGVPTPVGALCSAHYFTFHQRGFVAQAWYQQGIRILDVRDAHDIKQVGYFFTGAMESWHAYWAPARDDRGRVTGKSSNIIYTNDVARGIDVLRVDLPKGGAADTAPLEAPILPSWTRGEIVSSLPSDKFGYACRLPAAL